MSATGRWEYGLAVALAAVALGIVLGDTAVFLSSVVALSYVGYGYATRPSDLDVTVDRRLETDSPAPGESVSVALSIVNEGDATLPDLRVIDDPPPELPVEGDATAAVSVRPGETVTLEYAVEARRGTHEFGDVTLLSRNLSGSVEQRREVACSSGLECEDLLERMPLSGETIQHAGRVETDVGGEGLEFYAIRSYHPTDPMNRVDWNRLAKTGELTTVEFREERAASVVVVVDCRTESAVAREPDELDGVDLSKRAAGRLVEALLAENNRVGVACYGDTGNYLLPRTGREQAARARRLLEGDWCGSFGRSGWLEYANRNVDRFCRHLDDEKQIVFVGPLIDREPLESIRRFRAYGHEVTVVCPTVAHAPTIGGRVERIEHRTRLRDLRGRGVRIVEWGPDEPLHAAIERAKRRWSR